MKHLTILALLASFSACSMSPPRSRAVKANEKPIHMCVPEVDDTCATYEMRECHELFVDGCLSGATKRHECIAKNGPACSVEVDWECPQGFVDGCDLEEARSTVHKCVATRGGVPCEQDIAFECPTGFVNLCETVKRR